MGGVKRDQGQISGSDALDDAQAYFVGDFALAHMTPPDQYVLLV